MIIHEINKRKTKAILCSEAVILLLLVIYTIHDTNVATGAGYYLFLKYAILSRNGCNILLDCLITALVCLAAWIPTLWSKEKLEELCLLFISGVALINYIRPDRLLLSAIAGEKVDYELFHNKILSFIIAFMILLAAKWLFKHSEEANKSRKRDLLLIGTSVLFVVPAVLFPLYSDLFLWISGYFILISVIREIPRNSEWAKILFASVLFIRGMWRLYFVMATYHL